MLNADMHIFKMFETLGAMYFDEKFIFPYIMRLVLMIMLLCVGKMGREVTDIVIDQEHVATYTNLDSPVSPSDSTSVQGGVSGLYGQIKANPDPHIAVNAHEDKDFSQMVDDGSTEINQNENAHSELDASFARIRCEDLNQGGNAVENEDHESNNQKEPSPLSKLTMKSGNIRANWTVPQPFTLATDKRASYGTRSPGTEANTGGNRSVYVNVQSPRLRNILVSPCSSLKYILHLSLRREEMVLVRWFNFLVLKHFGFI